MAAGAMAGGAGRRVLVLGAVILGAMPVSVARAEGDAARGSEVALFACDVDPAGEPLEAEIMAIAGRSLAMRVEPRSGLVLTDRGRLVGGPIAVLSDDLVAAAARWRELDGGAGALLLFDRQTARLSVVWVPPEGPPRLVRYDCEPVVEG